jgi:D-glycero-D-manno-heptose 1,7-bisphosphate phosphatase
MAVTQGDKAVFLDKDGTLVEDVPYNVDPAHIRFTAGAIEGLRLLVDRGFRIFVVSNQPGVALGRFSEKALSAVERHISEELNDRGVTVDGFYYCPHHPQGAIPAYAVRCGCRKPRSGMLMQAARDHGIELTRSWMVGDILDDIEAGRRARCRTILIDNGNETEWDLSGERWPEALADDLLSAAQIVLASGAGSRAAQ